MANTKYMDNKKMSTINEDMVRELLDYDKETGILTWKVIRGSTIRPGDKAQTPQMSFMGVRFPTTHIIWLWMTGVWPKGQIDHINRQKSDNRFSNLRDIPQSTNLVHHYMRNESECIKELSSGQYAVNIDCGGQMLVVGIYRTYPVAAKVYDACLYLRETLQAQLDNK